MFARSPQTFECNPRSRPPRAPGPVGARGTGGRIPRRFVGNAPENGGLSRTSSFDWTDAYTSTPVTRFHEDDCAVTFPVMPLKKVKVVTDTVQLNVFESRYRTMMRLVKRSQSRVFGVTLRSPSGLSSVGVLCEMTHYIPVPTRKAIFISGRVIGRFEMEDVVHAKPFLCVKAKTVYDELSPCSREAEVWTAMCNVRSLVGSLTGGIEDDDEAFSLEVRRFSPSEAVRKTVVGAISSDPRMMAACRRAGLMGDAREPTPVTRVSRESMHCEDTSLAFISSEARMDEGEMESRRAEKHSFALARSLELGDEELLDMLLMRSTDDRLARCAAVISDSERYLCARSAINQLNLNLDG